MSQHQLLTPTACAVARQSFSDAERFRVSALVAAGFTDQEAVSVVAVQHAARMAARPAGRVVSRSVKRVRLVDTERTDDLGMPIVRTAPMNTPHRKYRTVGEWSAPARTAMRDDANTRAREGFRADQQARRERVARMTMGQYA